MISYFERLSETRFRPTEHTSGAWTVAEQHFSPLGGLLTHSIERFAANRGPDGLVTSRITFDILGTIAVEEFDVTVEVVRPGRTIELIQSTATWRGRAVATGRAWRLQRQDTSAFAGGEPAPLPSPDNIAAEDLTAVWPGGYIETLEFRPVTWHEGGRTAAWIRSNAELVAGEEVGNLARFVNLLDTANGIAVRAAPDELFYPNVDLTVHFFRQPTGPWVGFETSVVFGPDGQGLTSTVLHDEHGPVGHEEQMLTIRPPLT